MKPSELLNSPEKWVKGANAANQENKNVTVDDETACKWCAYGAMLHCYSYDIPEGTIKRLNDSIRSKYTNRGCFGIRESLISLFNDHPDTTFEEMRGVLIEAGL